LSTQQLTVLRTPEFGYFYNLATTFIIIIIVAVMVLITVRIITLTVTFSSFSFGPKAQVGQGLLIHEVFRSYTTTHHSR